ncbi:ATP-binding sensor histidine kinase [Scytonema hofmannii]|uniref:trifunctional serine/threonine-protein kinase/ATP-binding protein/sensor histidine kinase n=1 Tax=Scytonema hofmannii TaxID=34078 RepID=UPI000382C360|nr:ATP-binding sensor histidine kinase [Scytonema hofmannii]
MNLTGYLISQQIYLGHKTVVYRGIRELDRQPVIIKMMRNEYPSFKELIQFRNQFTIAKNLHLEDVIKTYSLELYENSYVLVMEDFGGISLKDYVCDNVETRHGASLREFLQIAIQIVTALEGLYRHRIIHKDIKPANILINPSTKQVKLIDFSIASLLPRETQTLTCPNVLEGTLAYLSPEQTGRMNRGIDYRSDFYSLGVTFFELLTGQLPFTSNDPMELIHYHIAQQPPLVHHINSEIPPTLSAIANKLMAKNAEDRYQSAFGLRYDLEVCLHSLEQTGNIYPFELAKRDICDRFLIPEKLYGRAKEVKTLLEAFGRVAYPLDMGIATDKQTDISSISVTHSLPEMMMVAGFSGIGKTAVVNEIHKPIAKQQGYFIKGKYDQYKRDVPLSGVVQALQDLIGQLLSESDAQLHHWKDKILAALGENAQVMIDVIPELEQILGQQPPILELSATAAQNRFNLLFQQFIQVFATIEHPLVIFLDDLQWADLASLKLMKLLMTDTRCLLMIGAYRDNEVFPAHPLMLMLQDVNAIVNTITLTPLSITDINDLIADTLSCSTQLAQPLAELVYQKTQGNPFFTNQFLKSLYNEGLISFDFQIGSWQCDIARVKMLALTEDVVEFMARQLQKLPIATQTVLKLAACIGNSFDLATLAIVYEQLPDETAVDLWKALQEGLVIPTTEVYKFYQDSSLVKFHLSLENSEQRTNDKEQMTVSYKFLHDRVQQAAYSLIPEDKKQATHLKIGQLLLSSTPKTQQEEKIFEIVNQLNYGVELIIQETERDNLASLNLIAGRKSKTATAYTTALKYLITGIQLLASNCWENNYNLTLFLYQEAAESAYLAGRFEQMIQLADVVLQKASLLLEQVKVYEVKILAFGAQNKAREAVEIALTVLKMLGQELPLKPNQSDIQQAMSETTLNLNGRCVEDLINLPEMTDVNLLAAMRILSLVITFSYQAAPELFPLILLKQVNLSLQYGNAPLSAFAYVAYGLTLCGVMGDIEQGYQFGKLALNLLVKFNAKEVKAKVIQTFNALVRHWKEHTKEILPPLLEAYSAALETGDLEFAALSLKVYSYSSYFIGKELTLLEPEMATYSYAISQLKQEMPLAWTSIFRQVVLNLLGTVNNPWDLCGKSYDEEKMLPLLQQANDRVGLLFLFFSKLQLCYLFGEFQQAVEYATLAEKYLDGGIGQIVTVLFYFYDSLSRLAVYSESLQQEQKSILDKVQINQEKLQKWAHHAPMNYLHKFYLVEAERHRVLNQKSEAIEMYDRATSLAKENEYLNEEALAQELAAKFYLEWGKQRIAQDSFINAYYCYARWSAKAKVYDLEKRYPDLLKPILQQEKILLTPGDTVTTSGGTTSLTSISSTSVSEIIDLTSVIKASQTLSSEIELDKLLDKLMQVVMENAGAKKCVLILPHGNKLVIEAIATISETPTILQSIPVESSSEIPLNLIYYVKNTLKTLVIDDTTAETYSVTDAYLNQYKPKSVLCTPIINQGKLIGILYLENSLTTGAFTSHRLQVLNLLISQVAISLENARLYQKSQELYQQMQSYAQQLEYSLTDLKQMQLQLIQSEKMSALGNLVAGVAHEINNPVGFIVSNLQPTQEYIRDLFHLIDLYQQKFPHPGDEILEEIEAIDLEYLRTDFPKLINSLKLGTDRIRNISISLRSFSRADTTAKVLFNLHEGIDSTLLILKHRLKANKVHPEINIIKDYGDLPLVKCLPGQLNQVFMNILANAIDAIEESLGEKIGFIWIHTQCSSEKQNVIIRIKDNGVGMPDALKSKIFDHLFTTKAVGKGTGLGLSIAHQIVVEQHQGVLEVNSVPGEGSEFIITLPL